MGTNFRPQRNGGGWMGGQKNLEELFRVRKVTKSNHKVRLYNTTRPRRCLASNYIVTVMRTVPDYGHPIGALL